MEFRECLQSSDWSDLHCPQYGIVEDLWTSVKQCHDGALQGMGRQSQHRAFGALFPVGIAVGRRILGNNRAVRGSLRSELQGRADLRLGD